MLKHIKIPAREIKDTNKLKDTLYLLVGNIHAVKISIRPKINSQYSSYTNFKTYLCFMWLTVSPALCFLTTRAHYPLEAKSIPGTWVTDGCELACWELQLGRRMARALNCWATPSALVNPSFSDRKRKQ